MENKKDYGWARPKSAILALFLIAGAFTFPACTSEKQGLITVTENQSVLDQADDILGPDDIGVSINSGPTCGSPETLVTNNLAGTRLSFNLKNIPNAAYDPDGGIVSFGLMVEQSSYLNSSNSYPCTTASVCSWNQTVSMNQEMPAGDYKIRYKVWDSGSPAKTAECEIGVLVQDKNLPPVARDMTFTVAPSTVVRISPFNVSDPEGNPIVSYDLRAPASGEGSFDPICSDNCPLVLNSTAINYTAPPATTNRTIYFAYSVKDSAGADSNIANIKIIIDGECGAGRNVTEYFDLDITQANRDANIHFVVDTSGSMSNEIDQIRTNLATFVTSIKDEFNSETTKFIMNGTRRTSTQYILDNDIYTHNATTEGIYWHYTPVDSRNKLQAVMKSYHLDMVLDNDNVLQKLYGNKIDNAAQLLPAYSPEGNCTRDGIAYNCDAVNHIVIVTDDDEKLAFQNPSTPALIDNYYTCTPGPYVLCNQDEIESVFKKNFFADLARNRNTAIMHAIHAKSGVCSVTNTSTIYGNLATLTGGLSLDICVNDWSSLFTALKESIVSSIGANAFDVCKAKDRDILSVTITWGTGTTGNVRTFTSGWVYLKPNPVEGARIYFPIPFLESQGIPVDGTMLRARVDYKIK